MLIRSLALLLCITFVPELSAQNPEPPESSSAPLYVIQSNDLLRIFVLNQPELSGQVRVRPDGRISLPLVQDIQAAGKNPRELKDNIEENLREYIDAPSVTVIVDAIESYRIFVTGQVARPGAIASEKPITVLQALALAGGYLPVAKPVETVIVRSVGESSTLFRFNYPEVIKGENFNQNILLRSGDVVVVP
jgi:polysaccharide export outer membrane protein